MALIAPSMLAVNFARLGEALSEVKSLGASIIHIDVMDGHFGPEISVGQPVVGSVRQATELELDVHLLVERPERYLHDFIRAGADRLAIHIEATRNACRAIQLAKEHGVKVGLALQPETPVQDCFELLQELDYLLILSAIDVRGQAEFLRRTIGKVGTAAREREKQGLNFAIEVEGGIGPNEAEELAVAGADILVVGSAIFGSNDRNEAMRELTRRANPGFSNKRQETKPRVQ
ncbi:MAG TPA: ribulose-phosphate 3-epimerase [Terriglobia bacterium]|nr:ribulose-phosphate 3-epimerase [Terriglobia bacterium]